MSLSLGEREPNEDTKSILMQKYGIIEPQFTASEKNIIRREEKRYAKFGV
jgi:hypothetical protein